MDGVDLRDNEKPVFNENGTYSTYLFGERAVKTIAAHNKSEPLFLYMPFQSVHAPLQVPKYYEDMYAHIKTKARRIYSGMVTAMDDAIGVIIKGLQDAGMMNDTIVIFTTDNGGPTYLGANNLPLRGAKTTLWEGGTRGSAFVYSSLLKSKGYTYDGVLHAADWFPTILDIAGAEHPAYKVDGISMWKAITENKPSPRTKFVYNLNVKGDKEPAAAIRVGDWKLIVGSPGRFNGWYPEPTLAEEEEDLSDTAVPYLLFNIKDDPTEHFDLSKKEPEKLKEMIEEYQKMAASEVKGMDPPGDPRANPKYWGGAWSPGWC